MTENALSNGPTRLRMHLENFRSFLAAPFSLFFLRHYSQVNRRAVRQTLILAAYDALVLIGWCLLYFSAGALSPPLRALMEVMIDGRINGAGAIAATTTGTAAAAPPPSWRRRNNCWYSVGFSAAESRSTQSACLGGLAERLCERSKASHVE